MENNLKLKTLVIFLLCVFSFADVLAKANSIDWVDHNVFVLTKDHIRMQRPNDKWRVITEGAGDDSILVSLTAYKTGSNREIVFRKNKAQFLTAFHVRESQFKKQKLFHTFLKTYEEEGFQFYKTEFHSNFLLAEGVNAQSEILLLKFYFTKPHFRGDYYVLSTQIARENYLSDSPKFNWVSDHIEMVGSQ